MSPEVAHTFASQCSFADSSEPPIMAHYQLLESNTDLYPIGTRQKSRSPILCQRPHGNETPGVVPANVLCSRCSRIINKSKLIRVLLSGDKEQIRKEAQENYTNEAFFHSYTICDILASGTAGCHICSIISTSQEIEDHGLDRKDPDAGIIQARVKFEAYDEETDEHRLYLCIEDYGRLPIPANAGENYDLLDNLLQEQLDKLDDQWASQIDYLKILPIKGRS